MASGSSNDLASLFECPVCFDYALPPIMQCQSGHIVCSSCRPKLSLCPTCRGPLGEYILIHTFFWNLCDDYLFECIQTNLGNIRNLAMEKVAVTVSFPCKYSSSGCPVTLIHTEKTDHEETCEFR